MTDKTQTYDVKCNRCGFEFNAKKSHVECVLGKHSEITCANCGETMTVKKAGK
jgi:predicted RNA-binding Zn-ribbon protein involved in translation (DUF1610 family)